MPIMFFISIAVVYFIYGISGYLDKIRLSPYYFLVAIVIPVIGNLLWAYYSQKAPNHNEVLRLGVYWDTVVTVSFFSAAFLFGSLSLEPKHYLGMFLILTGGFLLR